MRSSYQLQATLYQFFSNSPGFGVGVFVEKNIKMNSFQFDPIGHPSANNPKSVGPRSRVFCLWLVVGPLPNRPYPFG